MSQPTVTLHPQIAALKPALVIFDKDGTLIDFQGMWEKWMRDLARRLEAATYLPVAEPLFAAMDFDPETGYIAPGGELAVSPMADLKVLTRRVLAEVGVSDKAIETAITTAWRKPDEVAKPEPLMDLHLLFSTLQEAGSKVAIATSDDHAPTQAMIEEWGLSPLVDMIIGADDGLPIKPAPDVILHICHTLNVSPAQTIMVGDNIVDHQMGQAAQVGLKVGVLTGVSPEADLARYADLLLPSIQGLISPVG